MTQTEAAFFDPKTKNIFTTIGVLLIVGFILPVYGRELLFMNIEYLGESRVPFGVKFQLIYPLLAGIGIIVIANQKRNLVTALLVLLLAILPFIIMAEDRDFSKLFSSGRKGLGIDFDFINLAGILSFVTILGGAYSSVFLKRRKIGTYIALGGVVIFALSLFVKGDMNESIPLIDSLRMIISPEDYYKIYGVYSDEGDILVRLMGIVLLTSLILRILASYSAFLMINEGESFERNRKRVISYWIASIVIVVVSFFVVLGVIVADKGGPDAFLGVFLVMLKMAAWIGALMALLPLALSELLVLIDSGAKFVVPAPVAAAGKKFANDLKETVGNAAKSTEKKTPPTTEVKKPENVTPPVKEAPVVKPEGEVKPNQTIQKLSDLKKMFDQGLITQEEYDMVRKDLLKNM